MHAAVQAEGVPCPLALITDLTEREQRQREYKELWRYLFAKHLAELPEEEQRAFQDRPDPSRSHDRVEVAEPATQQLSEELEARGIAAEVSVARCLDGRTVLGVLLPEWPVARHWPDDLSFYRGFEAHICCRIPTDSSLSRISQEPRGNRGAQGTPET